MTTLSLCALCTLMPVQAPAQPIDLLASMSLWERHGGSAESFELVDGQLTACWSREEPAALLTRRDFENFNLTFEYEISQWGESGLFIHAPRNGAFRAGLEIELADTAGWPPSPYTAGAIFRHVPPAADAVRKHGEWNTVHVRMDWPRLVVKINDQTVQNLDLAAHEELRYTLRRGAIGFQSLGWPITIRNLKLQPLPDTENAVALFNGNNLAGWKIEIGNARWDVRNEAIIGADGDGYLRHEGQYQDFDLRLYIRTSPAANGGVYFRWLGYEPFPDRGYEVQILDLHGAIMPTGSIYGLARGNDLLVTPGQWQLLQLFVREKHALVRLNGVTCAESTQLDSVRPGHITLQMHRGDASIEFKDIHLTPADR
ncbi:MAG: DUF1080 domain-containing protein [Phycisphaerae bacterium]|nr:DUF1080 domain-containing protein [Phycisphaerae bacterium]